ncbi:MAG TPA: metallophosphoesterase family protein [Beijerinckiaceae bacterium]|nr:metallophosphoesterase family protein [Beijerinckiaceae bacterium]
MSAPMYRRLVSDGPLLFCGGPYSNLEATRALLAAAASRRIPPERIVCTGDVVAYGADAKATIDLVRQAGIHVVMGNCEEALAQAATDCGCGFAPGSTCDRLSAAWFAHAQSELGPTERTWMAALPRRLDVELAPAGVTLAVVHGSLDAINRFVFASTPAAIIAADLERCGTDGIVAGHCGLPFTEVVGGRLWHNPGAIGVPANDGTPRVWFSVIAPGPGYVEIEHVSLDYDHRAAAAKMRAVGLPEGYADALATGLWPSCDVLPPAEAAARGVPLEAAVLRWKACPRGQRTSPAADVASTSWTRMTARVQGPPPHDAQSGNEAPAENVSVWPQRQQP